MSLAAHLTGLQVKYIDAVTNVEDKALPPGDLKLNLSSAGRGSWRSHLNAARWMAEENIQSALVLKDDADWDIRIKEQMCVFARASTLLVQPKSGGHFLDPSYQDPASSERRVKLSIEENTTSTPSTSPYGDLDRWDLLWLGHCGARFPWSEDQNLPFARVVIHDDETVPERKLINPEFGSMELNTEYPDHTRVVARAAKNTCSLAYALPPPGAKRLLYELGIREQVGPPDMELRSFCEGAQGRSHGKCLTVQPQLFEHHRPVGLRKYESDISEASDDVNDHAFTLKNIRWSARLNILRILDGRTDCIDQYPDSGDED